MIYFISLFAFLSDFLTKFLIVSHLELGQSVPVFSGFNLFLVMNKGISFSFLTAQSHGGVWGLIIMAGLICLGIIYFIQHEKDPSSKMALALILGGALGNILDRIRYGAVIDFLDFYIGSYHWPAFNLADSFICIGVCFLLIKMFIKEKK